MKLYLPSLLPLAAYGLSGAALTSLSRSAKCGERWMAWVPFARLYLLGSLADLYTDNHLTADADRDAPDHHPSDLRHKLLRSGMESAVSGVITAILAALYAVFCAIPLLYLIAAFLNGEITAKDILTGALFTDVHPLILAGLQLGTVLLCASVILFLIFTIRFLTAYGTALARVFRALNITRSALWAVLGVLIPYLAAILLFVRVRRAENPQAGFLPNEKDAS